MCRFLPFWLPGPTATSVLLWRTLGKCFLNRILSPGVELAVQTLFARPGRGEKSDREGVSSHPAGAEPHPVRWWPLRDLGPGLRALNRRVVVGYFCLGGLFGFFGVCVNCA